MFLCIFAVFFFFFKEKQKFSSNLYSSDASKQNGKVHVFRTGFIHYIQKCCRHLSPSSTVEQVGLVISWIRITRSVCLSPTCLLAEEREPPLAQDVQVDGRGFSHGEKDLLNVLNVQPLLRFPLPAAQHDVVDLLGTDPWPLQDTTLGDALDHLQREGNRVTAQLINQDESRFGLSETLNRKHNLRFFFFFLSGNWEGSSTCSGFQV